MDDNTIIKNKAEFETTAQRFLDKIFKPALENNLGDIEIRTFPNGQWPEQYFCETAKEAAEIASNLCNSGIDVYFGVNPRTGKRGKKENVHYVSAFHAEIDYGADGHKKKSDYENYDDAIRAITKFHPQPTLINLSGGGLHCYWVLRTPVETDEIGVHELENINKVCVEKLSYFHVIPAFSKALIKSNKFKASSFVLNIIPRLCLIISYLSPVYVHFSTPFTF